MLQITIPTEELSTLGEMARMLAQIKNCEIQTIHEWVIPCASSVRLKIRLEGPPGFVMNTECFDQAIQLLTVAKEGAAGWPGDCLIHADQDKEE